MEQVTLEAIVVKHLQKEEEEVLPDIMDIIERDLILSRLRMFNLAYAQKVYNEAQKIIEEYRLLTIIKVVGGFAMGMLGGAVIANAIHPENIEMLREAYFSGTVIYTGMGIGAIAGALLGWSVRGDSEKQYAEQICQEISEMNLSEVMGNKKTVLYIERNRIRKEDVYTYTSDTTEVTVTVIDDVLHTLDLKTNTNIQHISLSETVITVPESITIEKKPGLQRYCDQLASLGINIHYKSNPISQQ